MHDAYLAELTGLRDQLKAGLSANSHQPDKEEGPSAAELADKIKALKAINTIEVAPQRARQKHSTAEEPITARIRRRAETTPVSAHAGEPDPAADAKPFMPTEPQQNSVCKPPLTFQERVILERQRNGEGEGQGPGTG